MSFAEWLENGVMRRHPEWFECAEKAMPSKNTVLSKNEAAMAVKAQMPKVDAKAPEIKPQVAKEAVLEDDWDAAEEVEVEQDEYWR